MVACLWVCLFVMGCINRFSSPTDTPQHTRKGSGLTPTFPSRNIRLNATPHGQPTGEQQMSKLVKGNELPREIQEQVKRAYIYRWTIDNKRRKDAWAGIQGQPTIPLQTDAEWLAEHAFYVTDSGQRLSKRHTHCEPHYVADYQN